MLMSERVESSLLTFWENVFKALFEGIHVIFPFEAIPLCINNIMFTKLERGFGFVPACWHIGGQCFEIAKAFCLAPIQQMHKYFCVRQLLEDRLKPASWICNPSAR